MWHILVGVILIAAGMALRALIALANMMSDNPGEQASFAWGWALFGAGIVSLVWHWA